MQPGLETAIRPAEADDWETLTAIGLAAKASWGYPAQWMAVWAQELLISPDYIAANPVFVAERHGNIAGYYSLRKAADSWQLDHIMISPPYLRQGVGRELMEHLAEYCRIEGIASLTIISDPNAAGFYERFGAVRTGDFQTQIPERVLPVFRLDFTE